MANESQAFLMKTISPLYIRVLRVSNGIKDNNENDWWKRFNMIYVLKR